MHRCLFWCFSSLMNCHTNFYLSCLQNWTLVQISLKTFFEAGFWITIHKNCLQDLVLIEKKPPVQSLLQLLLFIYIFFVCHVCSCWIKVKHIHNKYQSMQIITLNDLDICNGMTVFTLKCYERYRNFFVFKKNFNVMSATEGMLSDTDWYNIGTQLKQILTES